MTRYYEKRGLEIDMFSVDYLEGVVGISHKLNWMEAEYLVECIRMV
jgi:hypothetical protein